MTILRSCLKYADRLNYGINKWTPQSNKYEYTYNTAGVSFPMT